MKNLSFSPLHASAFSKTDAFIYLLDQDGFLIDCNHNLLRFLGFDNINLINAVESTAFIRIKDSSIGAIPVIFGNTIFGLSLFAQADSKKTCNSPAITRFFRNRLHKNEVAQKLAF